MSSYGQETLWYPVIPLCPDSFRSQEQKLLLWNDVVMFFWIQTIDNGFIHDGCIRVNGFGRVGVGGNCWMTSGCLMTLQEKSCYKTPMLIDILLSFKTAQQYWTRACVCACVCEDSWCREREGCTSLDPIKNAKITPTPTHLPSSANAQHCKVLGYKHIPSFLAAGSLLLSEEPWGFWESLACPAPCWQWLSCESQDQRRGWESPACSLQTTQSVTKPMPATATKRKKRKKQPVGRRFQWSQQCFQLQQVCFTTKRLKLIMHTSWNNFNHGRTKTHGTVNDSS